MSTTIDFKNLWQQQRMEMPDVKELLRKVQSFKRKNIRKYLFTTVLLVVTSIVIIGIGCYFKPQFITTKVGILMVIFAMVLYLISYRKLFKQYRLLPANDNNQAYLEHLINIQKREKYMQTVAIRIYYVLLTIGICLYLYEYVQLMSWVGACIAYGATFLWMIFIIGYVGPIQVRKQSAETQNIIAQFERIKAQFHQ